MQYFQSAYGAWYDNRSFIEWSYEGKVFASLPSTLPLEFGLDDIIRWIRWIRWYGNASKAEIHPSRIYVKPIVDTPVSFQDIHDIPMMINYIDNVREASQNWQCSAIGASRK